jgi:hypothetical protein
MAAIVRQSGQGEVIESFDPSLSSSILDQLSNLGADLERYGIDPGDALAALAKKRKDLDGFGIFCKMWGNLMSFIGPGFTSALSIFSLCLTLKAALQKGVETADWLITLVRKYWPFFALVGGLGGVGGIWYALSRDTKERDAGDVLSRIGNEALTGFILGLLPAPIAAVANIAVSEIGSMLGLGNLGAHASTSGSGLGGGAVAFGPQQTLASGEVPGSINIAGYPGLSSAASAIWGALKGQGIVSDDDIRKFASANGLTYDEVASAVRS